MKLAAIIPHYRHIHTLPKVITALQQENIPIFVVDDGSGEEYQDALNNIEKQYAINLFRLPENHGKGFAVKYGIEEMKKQGFSHSLQIDADAQHDFNAIFKLKDACQNNPKALICANPIYGKDAPKSRLYGRKITNFWNVLHTFSFSIKDGLCGFRIYPINDFLSTCQKETVGNGMDFDNEILIRMYRQKIPIIWIDTPVTYQDNGISHFKMWQDNIKISKMHARLFLSRFLPKKKDKN